MRLRNNFHPLFLLIAFGCHAVGIMIAELFLKDAQGSPIPLFLGGFWITYPALRLSFGRGLLLSIAVTLWMQSFSCYAMGPMLGLATILYTLLQWGRHSFQETARLPFALSGICINGLWIASLYLLNYKNDWQKGTYVSHALLTLTASSIFILILSPFWVKTMDRLRFLLNPPS